MVSLTISPFAAAENRLAKRDAPPLDIIVALPGRTFK